MELPRGSPLLEQSSAVLPMPFSFDLRQRNLPDFTFSNLMWEEFHVIYCNQPVSQERVGSLSLFRCVNVDSMRYRRPVGEYRTVLFIVEVFSLFRYRRTPSSSFSLFPSHFCSLARVESSFFGVMGSNRAFSNYSAVARNGPDSKLSSISPIKKDYYVLMKESQLSQTRKTERKRIQHQRTFTGRVLQTTLLTVTRTHSLNHRLCLLLPSTFH
jgi:hypothetical protein